MRIFLFILPGLLMCFTACKTCNKNKTEKSDTTVQVVSEQVSAEGKTMGKISHQYRSGGCPTVIIVSQSEEEPLILIPKDPLPDEFDKDGLAVMFNYRLLRMPNPEGCMTGIPAEISDLERVK